MSLLVFLVGERVEELRSGHINFPSPRMSAYLRRVVIQCWMLNQIKYGMLFKLLSDPRTYTQIHTPTVVQVGGGGWMEPLPSVMLQYLKTILPLVESL